MKIYRSYHDVPMSARHANIAIGNFDGVHRGHQTVLNLAREQSSDPMAVMTFEPHPRGFFAPPKTPFCLMSPAAKAHRLAQLGVDILYELPFNAALAALSPYEFAKDVLSQGLGARSITVGADFCFGKGRAGSVNDLQDYGRKFGFDTQISRLVSSGDEEISSTAIRRYLAEGAPDRAAELMGHWHRIEGPVLHGEKRGRTLGYPTANMSMDGIFLPKLGVYAVIVDIEAGPHKGRHFGAASLGVRPMFGENTANLETFFFDFDGDLYGTDLSVALVSFLRPELSFASIDALKEQMQKDCDKAREKLKAL